jgi:hypothetical protein
MQGKRFSIEEYKKLLVALQRTGRPFVLFLPETRSGILLRVDVDFDLEWAVPMALANRELSIQGTFFVQVASPLYNALAPESRRALEQIMASEQHIGLHYHHEGGKLDMVRLEAEYEILRRIAPVAERVVAWHNPEGDLSEFRELVCGAGFIIADSEKFYGPDKYMSDTNRGRRLDSIVKFVMDTSSPLVQVLLHPVNWVWESNNIKGILKSAFHDKLKKQEHAFCQNRAWKRELSREVIDWLDFFRNDREYMD